MKKKLTLLLTISVVLVAAAVMLMVSGGAEAANTLDVSSGEGMFFDGMSLYSTNEVVTEIPVTYEAWVKIPAGYNKEQGVIYGNYEGLDKTGTRFRGFTYGRPYLTVAAESENIQHFYFSKADDPDKTVSPNLATSEWVHYVIVDDVASGEARCYINGELVGVQAMSETAKATSRSVAQRPMCLGGDYLVDTNPLYGNIRSVVIYSDVRTADEIKADMKSIDLTDDALISAYNLNDKKGSDVIEDAAGNYDMINNRSAQKGWLYEEQLPELEEYAYSIALIGDTQIISAYYPQLYHTYFDWLLENKDEHNIHHRLSCLELHATKNISNRKHKQCCNNTAANCNQQCIAIPPQKRGLCKKLFIVIQRPFLWEECG